MSGVSGITAVLTPTIDVADGNITFGAAWKNLENVGEEFNNMDCCFDINGQQCDSFNGENCFEKREFPVARRTFYPLSDWRITSVRARIRGVYKGDGRWGSFAESPTLEIKEPRLPEVEMEIVKKDGLDHLHVKVTPDAGDDSYGYGYAREVYRTKLTVTQAGKAEPHFDGWADAADDTAVLETYIPLSTINAAFGFGGSSTVWASAWSQGIAGDGPTMTVGRVFGWPNVPEITEIGSTADQMQIRLDAHATGEHPVDETELQILKSVYDLTYLNTHPTSAWKQVKVYEGAPSTLYHAMDSAKADLARGMHVYYRVIARHDGYERIGNPKEAVSLYVPEMTIEMGAAQILGATSGDDGQSVRIDIGWYANSVGHPDITTLADYSFLTEVSWAPAQYAWESTEKPSTFECDWKTAGLLPASSPYEDAARVWIAGLTEGDPVYVKARRIARLKDKESAVKPGKYSGIVMVIPVSAPAWVRLTAPAYVTRGEAIPLTWLLGTDAEQTGWAIACVANPGTKTVAQLDAAAIGIADGTDASGYAVINPDSIPAGATMLALRCSATTGGLYTASSWVVVGIADAPTCSLSAPSTVTARDFEATIAASRGATVALSIVSHGMTYATPKGHETQYAGDVVWSGVAAIGSNGKAVINGAPLVNGCTYDIRAVATDPNTGLRSSEVSSTFTVDFAHIAAQPSATVTVDQQRKYAFVSVSAPAGALGGDTCEVYRMTTDGAQLIASTAFGATVRDRFAPYASMRSDAALAYRIATVTKDGDRAWVDVPYQLYGDGLRLDWEDRYVELPYNLAMSEGYAKGFEAREHMDGITNGYWDAGCAHDASISTDLIRFESREQRELVREMARYPGAVFVRSGSGHAFDANVDLDEILETHDKGAVAVSLKATAIALTQAHMCGAGDGVVTTLPKEEANA